MRAFKQYCIYLVGNKTTDSVTNSTKYLTPEERKLFEQSTLQLDREAIMFCRTLLHTGGRISEVLELPQIRFDFQKKEIVLRTLKKRSKKPQFRAIPVLEQLLKDPNLVYDLEKIQRDKEYKKQRVWKFSRKSGWEKVKKVMNLANFDMEAPQQGLGKSSGSISAGLK